MQTRNEIGDKIVRECVLYRDAGTEGGTVFFFNCSNWEKFVEKIEENKIGSKDKRQDSESANW